MQSQENMKRAKNLMGQKSSVTLILNYLHLLIKKKSSCTFSAFNESNEYGKETYNDMNLNTKRK